MTTEERALSIAYLEGIRDQYIEGEGYERYPLPEYYAINAAIQALIQKPCEDCVSRKMVEEQMIKYGFHSLDMTITEFVEDELPSVYPVPKKGQWLAVTNGRGGHDCSICGKYAPSFQSGREHLANYCPNCGSKMLAESKMRDATPQEKASVDRYIESVSIETGVKFYDFYDPAKKCVTCIYNGQIDDECAFCTNNHLYKKSEE